MKEAPSISIGSSLRDKSIETSLLGEIVHLQRVGKDTDKPHQLTILRQNLEAQA
jgi:hypothetical protein